MLTCGPICSPLTLTKIPRKDNTIHSEWTNFRISAPVYECFEDLSRIVAICGFIFEFWLILPLHRNTIYRMLCPMHAWPNLSCYKWLKKYASQQKLACIFSQKKCLWVDFYRGNHVGGKIHCKLTDNHHPNNYGTHVNLAMTNNLISKYKAISTICSNWTGMLGYKI